MITALNTSPHNVARRLPITLTAGRALLGPVVLGLAVWWPRRAAFGACLIAAFLSDVFDGILARRLNVAAPQLRRLDSIADSVFYLCAFFAAWRLYPAAVPTGAPLLALAALEVGRYAFDFAKFRREASYHMWSSKLWGIVLFVAFFALLALGRPGAWLPLALYVGIAADIEGLGISIALRESRTDVPTVFHALRLRAPARN